MSESMSNFLHMKDAASVRAYYSIFTMTDHKAIPTEESSFSRLGTLTSRQDTTGSRWQECSVQYIMNHDSRMYSTVLGCSGFI